MRDVKPLFRVALAARIVVSVWESAGTVVRAHASGWTLKSSLVWKHTMHSNCRHTMSPVAKDESIWCMWCGEIHTSRNRACDSHMGLGLRIVVGGKVTAQKA